MNTPDISPLVKGVLVIVSLAIMLGQYPRLAHWAQSQAIQAMEWHEPLPYFFAAQNPRAIHRPHPGHSAPTEKGGQS